MTSKAVVIFGSAALVAFSASCARELTPTSSAESMGGYTAAVPNFHKVEGKLWRSGHPTPPEYAQLAKTGIHTVISLEDYKGSQAQADQERAAAEHYGIKFIWLPMSPSKAPTVAQVTKALVELNKAANGSMLVHCHLGSDRTGIVVAAYRITHDSWTVQDATAEMYKYGHAPDLSFWDAVLASFTPGENLSGSGAGSGTGSSSGASSGADAPVIGGVALDGNQNVKLGVPQGQEGAATVTVSRAQYVLSWNETNRELNWAAWRVSSDDLGYVKRQNDFAVDPDLNSFLEQSGAHAVGPHDFESTCLDRGHQVASADRTSTAANNSETFLMSNIIPQTAFLNRGAWEHLEVYTRSQVKHGQAVYVYAGPIFSKKPPRVGAGTGVALPAKDFKILAHENGEVITAVIMPNTTSRGTDPAKDKSQACQDQSTKSTHSNANDWKNFVTTVGDIESQSGLAFPFLKH